VSFRGVGEHRLRLSGMLPLLIPMLLQAQEGLPVPLDSGALLRMHLFSDVTQGRLLAPASQGSPSLTYCRYPAPPCTSVLDPRAGTIAVAQIIHLDVATGTRWKHGMAIGGVVGGVIGAFFISVGSGLCDTDQCRGTMWKSAAAYLGLGLGLGAVFGSTSVQWRPAW